MYARTFYILFAQRHLSLQSLDIRSHELLPERGGVEVAVDAPRLAKRNVQVEQVNYELIVWRQSRIFWKVIS